MSDFCRIKHASKEFHLTPIYIRSCLYCVMVNFKLHDMIQVREGCYVSKHICPIEHRGRFKNATFWKFSAIVTH